MKQLLLKLVGLLFIFTCAVTSAQNKSVHVHGSVVNIQQQAIEFATVALLNKTTKKPFLGTVTDAKGKFDLQSKNTDFYVEVSFMGFETRKIEKIVLKDGAVFLGKIVLKEDAHSLDEVVVQAERSQTEFKLDKRIFNVGKDLSTTGVSALEVLNNVPSVNVSIEGAISLRGSSGVQILINGKPSVIGGANGNTLGTITADMIEKIEVITNPSAKFDAEGTTGILNIVLKKEERKGLNGSISLNTGIPDNHSIGVSLNRRTEKFNLFTQLGLGYKKQPQTNTNINKNLISNVTIENDGKEHRNETFYNFILGADYYINPLNVVTLSGSYAYEIEEQPSQTNYKQTDASNTLISEWFRKEITNATNPKFRYELMYKKDFKDNEDHVLLFSALGSSFGKNQSSDFENRTISGADRDRDQKTRTDYQETNYTFKLDYTKPVSKIVTFETGLQYVIHDVTNDFSVSNLENNAWVEDLGLTNVFEYNQNVLGAYGTAAYEKEKFGFKLGLRLENTDLKTFLVNTTVENSRNFTNLFPSAHSSYKFSEVFSIQGGYSKRVYRPRLWDLNPFFNIRNDFTIRAGNPDLMPEFTDSYELTSILTFDKISLNAGLFHQYTTDMIESVSTFNNNVNTYRPENVGTNKTFGLEFNAKYTPIKSLVLTSDVTLTSFNREGVFNTTAFDFKSERLFGKLTTKVKINSTTDIEFTGRYNSGFKTFQGTESSQQFMDMGLRKKMLDGKLVASLGIRDVFASRISVTEADQEDFYLYNESFRGRFVSLGISYGFGKGEAMEYSGRGSRY